MMYAVIELRSEREPQLLQLCPHGCAPTASHALLQPAMRLKRHVELLESTLRHVGTRPVLPALSSPCTRSRYNSTTSAAYPERIAVLGGGVAGLASAYFVSREFPNSKVTVYEAGKDAGGWLKSVKKEVSGGEVLFELGPRTLRNATVTAHLVRHPLNGRGPC